MHASRMRLTILSLALAASAGFTPAHAFQIFQPVPRESIDYIRNAPPTAQAPFVHWDLREMPNCTIPWSLAFPVPDIDRDGNQDQAADRAAAQAAFTGAFNAWSGAVPVLVSFNLGASGAAVGAARGIALDNHNLLSFVRPRVDDQQCVAVGALAPAPNGVAANRPWAPVIAPGPDFILGTPTTTPDDQFWACIIDGGNGNANTTARSDVQNIPVGNAAAPGAVVVSAGPDGILTSPVQPGDSLGAAAIFEPFVGGNGTADSPADDDVTVIPNGNAVGACNVIITAGPNGALETAVAGDDRRSICIIAAGNMRCNTTAVAGLNFPGNPQDDVQTIPVGNPAAPNAIVVGPGPDGVLVTQPKGDDVIVGNTIREPAFGGNGFADSRANNQGDFASEHALFNSLGLTGIFFNNRSGVIIESDVMMDANTPWSINAHNAIPPANTADLQQVVTHEIGHFLGIAHPVDGRNNDDQQCVANGNLAPAPGGVGANRPFAPVVGPGPDADIATQPRGDDQLMACITVGNDGTCDEAVAGDDVEIVASGAAAPGGCGVAITAGPDRVLQTAPANDDVRTVCIVAGANGTSNTTAGNSLNGNPAPNNVMNPFYDGGAGVRCNQQLSADDQAAAHFLYTQDLGDAPDPYRVKIRNAPGTGRTLSTVPLCSVRDGALALLGTPDLDGGGTGRPSRYEWLGANENGSGLECEPRQANLDNFDDGVTIPSPLKAGAVNRVTVRISFNDPGGRYDNANPRRRLYFNAYLDYNDDKFWANNLTEHAIWWSGVPGATSGAGGATSASFVPGASTLNTNPIVLAFDVNVPGTISSFSNYARMRVDYGEDEGSTLVNGPLSGVNGDLKPATGVQQFGEVEDYPVTFENRLATVRCDNDQASDYLHPLTLNFCIDVPGAIGDSVAYSLSDPKGWITAQSAPLTDTIVMNGGDKFCLVVQVTPPRNCYLGELDSLCFIAQATGQTITATPDTCCTVIECTSPTPTLISNFTGDAGIDRVDLTFVLPDESDLSGIHVYRASGVGAGETRLTEQPIATDGTGRHAFTDRAVEPGTEYRYQLGLIERSGREVRAGLVLVRTLKAEFALGMPYPNPTEGGFSIRLAIPRAGRASVRVFDVAGRAVATLHDGPLAIGEHVMSWDGRAANGRQAGSGIYYVVYEAVGRRATERVVVMK